MNPLANPYFVDREARLLAENLIGKSYRVIEYVGEHLSEIQALLNDHQVLANLQQLLADVQATNTSLLTEEAARIAGDTDLNNLLELLDAVVHANSAAILAGQTSFDALSAQLLNGYEGIEPTELTSGLLYRLYRSQVEGDAALGPKIVNSFGSFTPAAENLIWHFASGESGWTGNGAPTVAAGLLRPANHETDPYLTSPFGLGVPAEAIKHIRLRVKKTGLPIWAGYLYWRLTTDAGFSEVRRTALAEPFFVDGDAEIGVNMGWETGTVHQIRVVFSTSQNDEDYFELAWIGIGSTTPGVSTATIDSFETRITETESGLETLTTRTEGIETSLPGKADVTVTDEMSSRITETEGGIAILGRNTNQVRAQLLPMGIESAEADFAAAVAVATAKQEFTAGIEVLDDQITAVSGTVTELQAIIDDPETGLAGFGEALLGLGTRVTATEDAITAESNARLELEAIVNDEENGLAATRATLLADYYTAAEVDSATTTQVTALQSAMEGPGGSVTAAAQAAADAASAANAKSDVLVQSSTPNAGYQRPQTLWIDTTGSANTPKRWNSGTNTWVAVTDKVATDAAAAAAAAQATADTKLNASVITGYYTKAQVDSAFATYDVDVESRFGNIEASGKFRVTTEATKAGAWSTIGLTAAANSGSGPSTAALLLSAMGDGGSQIDLNADRVNVNGTFTATEIITGGSIYTGHIAGSQVTHIAISSTDDTQRSISTTEGTRASLNFQTNNGFNCIDCNLYVGWTSASSAAFGYIRVRLRKGSISGPIIASRKIFVDDSWAGLQSFIAEDSSPGTGVNTYVLTVEAIDAGAAISHWTSQEVIRIIGGMR